MKELASTPRLILREFHENDLESFSHLHMHPDVRKHYPNGTDATSRSASQSFRIIINSYKWGKMGEWAIIVKETSDFVGSVGLGKVEGHDLIGISYRLLPEFWRNGYATEAATAILKYGFLELRLNRIAALTVVNPDNPASRRVIEKLNFTYWKIDHSHAGPAHFYIKQHEPSFLPT